MDKLISDPKLPIMGKELLRKLQNKEITVQEFDKEIAYWLISYVQDMFYKHTIEQPPEIRDYYERRRLDFDFTLPQSFWNQPHIREWLAKDHLVRSENLSNRYWLNKLLKDLPAEDGPNRAKITRALSSFPMTKGF